MTNAARGIVRAGYLCGAAFVVVSAVRGCVHGDDWKTDALWTSVFGVTALLLLWAVGTAGIRVLLRSHLPEEIARGNVAAGVAAGAHFAATGFIVAECFYGDDLSTLGISIVFFVIGQATLHLFVVLFRTLTLYAEDEEIQGENVAAAVSYAGAMLAIALIVGHAAEGDFEGWGTSLRAYAVALVSVLVLYPVRQFGVQTLLLRKQFALRGGALDGLVARERNVGVSAVEAVSYLAAAILLTGLE
ncbi:MAG TPA: DUF350 domain-containing protein [Myxococcales bacterium]|nr:DUF350 domain-containing protein [Myxococcales bacterium]